ncbi:MAG TPA: hypothetical protein DD671_06685, partial [Balneolaceae bacterium]|nr:hypothetical protein [Balneolaceae bacterium]
MKITKEELERIIREELEAILDEGKKEYGTGENYSQRRKRQKKLRPNIDPKDKTGEETDYHDINKQMADKFRGKYK